MTRATTPSKKLNEFLKANGRAVGEALRDQAAEHEIPADRDLSPESREALNNALEHLKKAIPTHGLDKAFEKATRP